MHKVHTNLDLIQIYNEKINEYYFAEDECMMHDD
jgi:hypothetical protein